MSVIKEILTLYVERADWFAELLLGHIALALTAIVLSGTIGLLVGVLILEHQRIAPPIMGEMCIRDRDPPVQCSRKIQYSCQTSV